MSKLAKRLLKKSVKMEPCETVCETSSETNSSAVPAVQGGYNVSFWSGRRLVMSTFNGQVLIHVREYRVLNGKEYPTKKCACFTPGRFRVLREKVETIDEILRQQEVNASYNVTVNGELYKAHLGAGLYVSVNEEYPGVSLRRHWLPEGHQEPVPTKNGIFLPPNQWTALKRKLDELLVAYPALADATACYSTHDGNQMGFFECRECMPFPLMETVYG